MADLFEQSVYEPLASILRPNSLEDYLGQEHLLAEGMPLHTCILQGNLHSMIFWGPPGVGKTSLAKLIAHYTDAAFISISAVLSGVKDIRIAVEKAKMEQGAGRKTILFVDEVHRFNKSQQDAFLPYVEDGTLIFIGATTENPSFELNNALLSRARVYLLKSLSINALTKVIQRALLSGEQERGAKILIESELIERIAQYVDGDARRTLNIMELANSLAINDGESYRITDQIVDEVLSGGSRRFDKGGDYFYDQISALHKSVRGSSPDGALYWFCRMIDGGCDPIYIARRVVRMASEDIGNADPRALTLALNAWDVQQRLGSPEGELAIAQAVIYLASAPKSNAVYSAFNEMMSFVKSSPTDDVPYHLRNAPTQLGKEQGFGAEYQYAHDMPGAYAPGENYFPESVIHQRLPSYSPVERGMEIKIKEKLNYLRNLDSQNEWQRYINENETDKI